MTISNSIIKRQGKEKAAILEQLRKTPIIQVACERAGVARASFYRWRKDDQKFNEEVEASVEQGLNLINDIAESQLLNAIKDQNLSAIIFWLRSHHNTYKAKVEVTNKHEGAMLTPEQEKIIKKALRLGLMSREIKDDKNESD